MSEEISLALDVERVIVFALYGVTIDSPQQVTLSGASALLTNDLGTICEAVDTSRLVKQAVLRGAVDTVAGHTERGVAEAARRRKEQFRDAVFLVVRQRETVTVPPYGDASRWLDGPVGLVGLDLIPPGATVLSSAAREQARILAAGMAATHPIFRVTEVVDDFVAFLRDGRVAVSLQERGEFGVGIHILKEASLERAALLSESMAMGTPVMRQAANFLVRALDDPRAGETAFLDAFRATELVLKQGKRRSVVLADEFAKLFPGSHDRRDQLEKLRKVRNEVAHGVQLPSGSLDVESAIDLARWVLGSFANGTANVASSSGGPKSTTESPEPPRDSVSTPRSE